MILLRITPNRQILFQLSTDKNGGENFMKLVLWVQLVVSLDCLATVAGIAWTWSGHLMILVAVSHLPIIAHRIEGKTL